MWFNRAVLLLLFISSAIGDLQCYKVEGRICQKVKDRYCQKMQKLSCKSIRDIACPPGQVRTEQQTVNGVMNSAVLRIIPIMIVIFTSLHV